MFIAIFYRLYLVRELAEYAKELGTEETKTYLLPILQEIRRDVEPVIRQALVEQVPIIARLLVAVPFPFVCPPLLQFNNVAPQEDQQLVSVTSHLLPIVVELTRDSNPQVSICASSPPPLCEFCREN